MSEYNDEVVTRSAPRWAWDIIDNTLYMDAKSKGFDEETRADVSMAMDGVVYACETGVDAATKEQVEKWTDD